MTHAPKPLRDLMALWVAQGGADLGIVGDTKHAAKGTSYHLGKSQLRADAYSIVQSARDRAGLSEAASAVDLGWPGSNKTSLFRFSVWLARRCQEDPSTYRDVREVIFSPDGRVVKRWDAVSRRLYTAGDGTGHGDNSHLWHTHVSFFRDSEQREKRPLFAPFFATASEEPEVDSFPLFEKRTFVTVRTGARLYDNSALRERETVGDRLGTPTKIGKERELVHVGNPRGLVDGERVAIVAYEPPEGDPNASSEARWVRWSDLVQNPDKPGQPKYRMVDDAASDSEAAFMAGRQAEWDRQAREAAAKVELAPRP